MRAQKLQTLLTLAMTVPLLGVATASPRTAGDAPQSPQRPGLGRRLRSALVVAVSAFVVIGALAYVAAPGNPTLELSVRELTDAPAYEHDLTAEYSLVAADVAARAKYQETFYGEVASPSGIPVSHARLLVVGIGKNTRGHDARFWIGGPGTYRAIVKLRPGQYRVAITADVDGEPKRAGKDIILRNGDAYEASLRVHEGGIVTMLPISTY